MLALFLTLQRRKSESGQDEADKAVPRPEGLVIRDSVYSAPQRGTAREPLRIAHLETSARGDRHFTVKVLDELNLPVSKASIFAVLDEGFCTLGMTATNGVLEGACPRATQALAARAPQYSVGFTAIGPNDPIEETIVLAMEGTIRGRVLRRGIRPPDTKTVVLAWRDGMRPAFAELQHVANGANLPSCAGCPVQPDGSFELRQLDTRGSYTLMACCLGQITDELSGVKPGPGEVDLVLERLYGVLIALRTQDGQAIESDTRLFGRGPVWSCNLMEATSITRPMSTLRIAGIDDGLVGGEGRRLNEQLILYRCLGCNEAPVVDYEVEVPGYQPVWTRVIASPVDNGIESATIRLSPVTVLSGSVTVECLGLPIGSIQRERPLGIVRLTNERAKFNFGLPVAGCTIDMVPAGSYQWHFENRDWPFSFPTSDENVVIGQDSRLTVDFSGRGSLQIELMRWSNAAYRGYMRFSMRSLSTNMKSILSYESQPYVVYGLAPGDYEISLDWSPTDEPNEQPIACVVVADETTYWQMTVPF